MVWQSAADGSASRFRYGVLHQCQVFLLLKVENMDNCKRQNHHRHYLEFSGAPITVRVAWWLNGLGVGLRLRRSRV